MGESSATSYDHRVHQILSIPAMGSSSTNASMPSFEGARLKLERASKHIAELKFFLRIF
jgi:hypothetical protein